MENIIVSNRRRILAPLLAASLLIAGCANSAVQSTPSNSEPTTTRPRGPYVEVTYPGNGMRLIEYKSSPNNKEVAFPYAPILEFCDGFDLVEQTSTVTGYVGSGGGLSGNAISRSEKHPACADGQLTPSDFTAPPK